MLSKAYVKYIKSLQVKKYRKQEQCFLVEGAKSVQELLHSDFDVVRVLGTAEFFGQASITRSVECLEVSAGELEGLGEFQTNSSALAIARMKPNRAITLSHDRFVLALDDLRDPGNFGTIIRTADWYGITGIVASSETADFYNSKVISATMGSFTRVEVFYTELQNFLAGATVPVFGAYLEGQNIRQVNFGAGGVIVIGNESRGISPELERLITHRITIPRYGQAESLNAAIATAVICDNLRRG
jgi:TrmH family RNA methyltransferase